MTFSSQNCDGDVNPASHLTLSKHCASASTGDDGIPHVMSCGLLLTLTLPYHFTPLLPHTPLFFSSTFAAYFTLLLNITHIFLWLGIPGSYLFPFN